MFDLARSCVPKLNVGRYDNRGIPILGRKFRLQRLAVWIQVAVVFEDGVVAEALAAFGRVQRVRVCVTHARRANFDEHFTRAWTVELTRSVLSLV